MIGGLAAFESLGDVRISTNVEGVDDVADICVGGDKSPNDVTAAVSAVVVKDCQRAVAYGRGLRKNRIKRFLEKRGTVVGDKDKRKA